MSILEAWSDTLEPNADGPEPGILTVRLTTSSWVSKRGIHIQRNLITLQRLSDRAHDFLREDAGNIGSPEVFSRITNLNSCEDGIYEVYLVNQKKDWETGHLEDYDYELRPYRPEAKQPGTPAQS